MISAPFFPFFFLFLFLSKKNCFMSLNFRGGIFSVQSRVIKAWFSFLILHFRLFQRLFSFLPFSLSLEEELSDVYEFCLVFDFRLFQRLFPFLPLSLSLEEELPDIWMFIVFD
jgi:hypothetical protein